MPEIKHYEVEVTYSVKVDGALGAALALEAAIASIVGGSVVLPDGGARLSEPRFVNANVSDAR